MTHASAPVTRGPRKLAWQKWYVESDYAFLSEQPAWTFRVETRRPYQPIVSCDAIGRARDMHLHEMDPDEQTLSCRWYDYFPLDEPPKS